MDDAFRGAADAALAALAPIPGVEYADVRVSSEESDQLNLRNREIERVSRTTSTGLGVRVLRNGAWGFAALPDPSEDAAERAARQAAEIAAGVALAQKQRVRIAEEEPQVGTYETPVEIDPFSIPVERRIRDLEVALEVLREEQGNGSPITSVSGSMMWRRTEKLFANTEGARTEQRLTFGGAGIKAVAATDEGSLQRTYPLEFDGGLSAAGYEHIARLQLAANAARIREELLELTKAPPCPTGRTSLILDTNQLALQIHESCGHPTECDRAMGDEISLAGASFLTPDKLGRFSYGSNLVNLTADSCTPGGLGTFGWDDEGVPARITPLVARGMFVGYLSSRETAAALGLGRSAGCMRAETWGHTPIIRMINISLEPDEKGPASLDELVADTQDGVLMSSNLSWSIDDLRLNFQFGCEVGWEIKHGRRTRLLRNPLYTGSTPAFWGGCDAICGPDAFQMWGLSMCGKGDPMQLMAVGHGCAPARFRNIEVGSTR